MEIMLVIGIIVLLLFAQKGFKKGFVKELNSLVSLVLTLILLLGIMTAVGSFWNHRTSGIVLGIILVVVIGIVYKLVSAIISSMKLLAKLKLFMIFDKLGGIVIGVAEGLVLLYIASKVLEAMGYSGFFSFM